ncbi:MAG: START-like domain-containing protein [Bernardetiaceae bacterium]|nr:START-like domain-containing protein [Bernardetiaceae bacterium]
MSKHKFTIEFEINTSPKMIYPYLSTPNGLTEWFAESVATVDAEEKIYDIVWDGSSHLARQVSNQTNKHVKFLFIDEQDDDPAYLEFKIAFNDLTETTFLKIIDYSDMVSDSDLRELWNNLVQALLELIGAKTTS